MLHLNQQPTLKDLQKYVLDMENERGFSKDVLNNCLMLGEEVGELFKAIRKHGNINKIDLNSKFGSVEEELADTLIFICAIANKFDIDLEKAFRDKEEINNKRSWK
ncbi:MAG TPA: MazG nucleotide pyrophosphohydrolase domain-containing protein [Patescibacteria group bacterium]|nr:MazG nucleotide pyrophosphohydrolase domain-containing protein [Patescibacteria group bacterium]